MKSAKTKNGYIVVCSLGEDVIASLVKFASENKIHSGTMMGIGALKEIELGYYDIEEKVYFRRKYDGEFELVSCSGNFALKDGEVILHCHAIFSDRDFHVIGGHLFSGKVAITAEFYIRPEGVEIKRGPDEATGLNLIKL